ncbi:acyltransferase domain-containing protein, partial [Streptomyces sp. NPDC003470]
MASLPTTADTTTTLIDELGLDDVHVAAHNAPTATVVSGQWDQVHTLVDTARERDIRARTIDVDYASHCPHVESLRHELLTELAPITPQATDENIAFYSTLKGAQVTDTTTLTAEYWTDNLRHPVLFHQTLTQLADTGHAHYIETSPHPVLAHAVQHTYEALHTDSPTACTTTPSLRRDTTDTHTFALNLATAHTHGLPATWPTHGPWTDLPTYPFQHQPYWLEAGPLRQGERNRGGMAVEPATETAVSQASVSLLAQRLAAEESAEEQLRIAQEHVLSHVAILLGHVTPETVDASRAFKELGFDSLAAVEFRSRLGSSVGLTLPTTLTFDHPTPRAVAGYLRSRLLGEGADGVSSVAAVVPGAGLGAGVDVAADPVVIVGMSCR